MAAVYSGRWKEREDLAPLRTPFRLDPEHSNLDAEDQNAFIYQAPALPEVGDVGEFPGLDVLSPLPGIVIDTTPETHDAPPHPLRDNDRAMQADSWKAHNEDHGASRAANHEPAILTFWDEQQVHTVVQNFGPEVADTINPDAVNRGRNGSSLNNPDGFRQGETHFWQENRKFYVGERNHDERPVTLNTPAFAGNVPAPSADKFTPYSSPFSSLARPITRMFNRPEIRRDPKSLTADIITDGAYAESQPINDLGVM